MIEPHLHNTRPPDNSCPRARRAALRQRARRAGGQVACDLRQAGGVEMSILISGDIQAQPLILRAFSGPKNNRRKVPARAVKARADVWVTPVAKGKTLCQR